MRGHAADAGTLRIWHDDADLPTRLGTPRRVVWCRDHGEALDGAVVVGPLEFDRAPERLPVFWIVGGEASGGIPARVTAAPVEPWVQGAFEAWVERLAATRLLHRALNHDLRSGVAAARGYVDLLSAPEVGALSARQRRYVASVGRGIDRFVDELDDLVTVGADVLWPSRREAPNKAGGEP